MSSKPKKRPWRNISLRLTIWYSSIFIFSSILVFLLAFYLLASSVREKDRDMIRAKMDSLTLLGQAGGPKTLLGDVQLEHNLNQRTGFFIHVVDALGRTMWLTLPVGWDQLKPDQIKRDHTPLDGNWMRFHRKGTNKSLEIISRTFINGMRLQVGRDTERTEKILAHFRRLFALVLVPVVLLGFGGGVYLSYRALRPVRDLIRAFKQVDMGRMDERIPSPQTGDELEELVLLFNGMLDRISALILGMREALDNVAHDLKTPLTRLRAGVETAVQEKQLPAPYRESLLEWAEDLERIVTMLNTLMDISEAETGTMRLDIQDVNLAGLAAEVVELYDLVAEDKGVTIHSRLPESLPARADPNRIRQVMANLMDNAVKYTPPGKTIEVTAWRESDRAVVEFKDQGPGISEEDLPHIYNRLYRGDKSRTHRGLGLGLSLVRAVAEAHNGDIRVETKADRGSSFALYLPVGAPPPSANLTDM